MADATDSVSRQRDHAEWWAFFAWSAGSYLFLTALLLGTPRGRVIYIFDDAAIHLDVARDLAYHFTWGIAPGHFESASSSPLWTVLLALAIRPAAFAATWLPLFFTLSSSLALLAILASCQKVLRPQWRRPVDIIAVVVLTNVVLFLPAMTLLGMEHVLHAALVVGAVALVARQLDGDATWGPASLPIALFVLAEATRFETIFVAFGLVVAVVIARARGRSFPSVASRSLALSCAAATAIPFAVFAVVNRAMGGGWLPNSLLSRSNSLGTSSSFSLNYFLRQSTKDHLLLACSCVLLVVIVWGWRELKGYTLVAIATLIAIVLQISVASIGQFERYQEYLIALTVYVALMAAGDVYARRQESTRQWTLILACAVVLSVLVSSQRTTLLRRVPRASADVYQQKFLAGEFLEKYYRNDTVASGELGWIAWLHHGPFVDLLGLGDYDILQELRATSGKAPATYWAHIATQDHVHVVVEYPLTLGGGVPASWILVGTWVLHRPLTTAYQRDLEFWVTSPRAVAPLQRHLRAFAPNLPRAETLRLAPYASLIAAREIRQQMAAHE